MRATLGVSATETSTILPSLLLVLDSLEVRMWRILDWPRLNLPVPVFLKRLLAPEWVLSFGIVFLEPHHVCGEENCNCTPSASIAESLRQIRFCRDSDSNDVRAYCAAINNLWPGPCVRWHVRNG